MAKPGGGPGGAAEAAYSVTHPDYRSTLETRFERILAVFGEPAQPGYKTGASATVPEPT